MSDANASAVDIGSNPASGETAVVTFLSDANPTPAQFSDAPPSEWAFAAHEAALDGEAIDAWREPEGNGLMPLVAAATFVIAEAELYADAEDALVAMTPTPFAFDIAIGPTSESADIGMVMWSGENGDSEGSIAPLVIHARGDAALTLTDIVPHGVSLDWTDTVLG